MDKKIENIVKVNVQAAIASVTPTNVNTMAILVKDATKAQAKAYSSLTSLNADYAKDSEAVKLAASFFAQSNRPDELVVITLTDNDYVAALNKAVSLDFYGVFTKGLEATDIAKLSDWASENFRMVFVEYDDFDKAVSIQTKINEGAQYARVATFFHKDIVDGTETGKALSVALGAVRNADDPARGTWCFTAPENLTPDELDFDKLKKAKEIGLNVFCRIAGVDGTYFGTTGAPTKFIDAVIKQDWVKFRVQEAIFDLLRKSDNGNGLEYSDSGIQAVGAAINSILSEGVTNKYVLENSYSVNVPTYASIKAKEKEKRNVPGITGSFEILASIHTVEKVNLYIVL